MYRDRQTDRLDYNTLPPSLLGTRVINEDFVFSLGKYLKYLTASTEQKLVLFLDIAWHKVLILWLTSEVQLGLRQKSYLAVSDVFSTESCINVLFNDLNNVLAEK